MAKYEVCIACDGEGKYVNPNVDGNGLTEEDFDLNPDLYGDYFSGVYDVTCKMCNGLRVVTQEQVKEYEDRLSDRDVYLAESGIHEGRGDYRL